MFCTFISAELDVSEQADLDDLPQQAQHQMGLPLSQVQSPDVHHVAADGRSRVQSQVQILLQGTQYQMLENNKKGKRSSSPDSKLN